MKFIIKKTQQIPEEVLANKKKIHKEMHKYGNIDNWVVGPCCIEDKDEVEFAGKFEERWIEQYLGFIIYYCMFDSSAHLPEKYKINRPLKYQI